MNSDTNNYNDAPRIDKEAARYWCRVIETIAQNVVKNMLRSMNTERFAEVTITNVNKEQNTVDCKNIQTGELLNNIPNYSNISIDSLTDENGNLLPFPTRGRIFITNIQDNPYYLGVWYN